MKICNRKRMRKLIFQIIE